MFEGLLKIGIVYIFLMVGLMVISFLIRLMLGLFCSMGIGIILMFMVLVMVKCWL